MTHRGAPASLLGHYAGFTSRALAFLIDATILGVSLVALSWILRVSVSMLQVRSLLGLSLQSIAGSEKILDVVFGPTIAGLLSALYILGYHTFFLTISGHTPGKAMLGLRVVRMNGKKLGAWQALGRVAGYLVSAIPLFTGFLWVLIDDRRQGWHDKIAGTCVVYTWAARPDESFLVEEAAELTHPDKQAGR